MGAHQGGRDGEPEPEAPELRVRARPLFARPRWPGRARLDLVDLEVNLPPESGDKVFVGSIPRDVRIFVRGSAQTIDNLRGGAVHMIST